MKPIVVIAAVLLFLILAFVTDFGVYLLLSIVMGIVSFLLVRTSQRRFDHLLKQLGAAFIIVPLILMLVVFVVKSQLHTEASDQLAASTIDSMVTFFGKQLPFVVLSDLAGAIIGGVLGRSS